MDDNDLDKTLFKAAFEMAADDGWSNLRVAEAARRADLPLDRVRARFPNRAAVLLRFGRFADTEALRPSSEGAARDRLFDILMRRIDTLQAHRRGVIALLQALPVNPATALMLSCANLNSMRWMLEGAGLSTAGLRGALRTKGLLAVWLWTVRAWQRDDSEDLSATMAALDQALDRAGQAEGWLGGKQGSSATENSTSPEQTQLAGPPV